MGISGLLSSFAHDEQLKAVVILIVADLVLGVLAAVYNKEQSFGLHFVANFMHNDVLGKVVPWFVLFAIGKNSSQSLLGVDFGTLADGAWAAVTLALVGSLTTSLSDFGVPVPSALGRKS